MQKTPVAVLVRVSTVKQETARQISELRAYADIQGCSQRALREWCKKGSIREAYQTRGGHWRIRKPLSWGTRVFLAKRRGEWPFKGKNTVKTLGKDWARVFEAERAEWYALAFIYQCPLNEDIPVPYIAEFPDFPERADNPADRKAEIARKFQGEITQMVEARAKGEKVEPSKFFLKLLLLGSVYQFWRERPRKPTMAEMAAFMGLSRTAFSRRYTRFDLNSAYREASGRIGVVLPDPEGFDEIQRANRRAKKRNFWSIQREYDNEKGLRFARTRRKVSK